MKFPVWPPVVPKLRFGRPGSKNQSYLRRYDWRCRVCSNPRWSTRVTWWPKAGTESNLQMPLLLTPRCEDQHTGPTSRCWVMCHVRAVFLVHTMRVDRICSPIYQIRALLHCRGQRKEQSSRAEKCCKKHIARTVSHFVMLFFFLRVLTMDTMANTLKFLGSVVHSGAINFQAFSSLLSTTLAGSLGRVLLSGGYVWGDFVKFGGILQLLHMCPSCVFRPK